MTFEFGSLFRPRLPAAAAAPFAGYPKYYFVGGNNDADTVPTKKLGEIAKAVLEREGSILALYGVGHGPQGYLPLRQFIAKTLHQKAALACHVDEILVTSGSLQALDLVNNLFLEPGDTVLAEEASYGGAVSRLKALGANVIGIDMDEDGMRMDHLRQVLADLKRHGIRPKFIYTIPTVQNPSGTVLTTARRLELLEIAELFEIPIFEDDCYADLLWEGERPPAIRALDKTGRVIYCGSFSKLIAPGFRVGYIVADWRIIAQILPTKKDGGSGALEQMVLAEFAASEFDQHVAKLSGVLRDKCQVMADALEEHFGTTAEFAMPKGGIFIWITLPDIVNTSELAKAALAEGVEINPGAEWVVDPATGKNRMRLCFASPSKQQIRDGVKLLAEICHRETGVPVRSANVARP
ncbi:MAG: PLP-dependent aminotransferase family protein [Rhodospirillales bacterium]|nr:PLP-dependent aminotransferase family protein [Rhodospirillales bacterium]